MLYHYHRIKKELQHQRLTFFVVLALNFFFSATIALTIYIDSSFLSRAISQSSFLEETKRANPEQLVGLIYTASSLCTIFALILAPYALRRFGDYRTSLWAITLYLLSLLGLAYTDSAVLILPIFVLAQVLIAVLYFNFDIFLERYSKDVDTGKIRGLYMVLGSIAWLLPPLFSGRLVDAFDYDMVYLTAALTLAPTLFLTMRYLNHFKDMTYTNESFWMTREEVLKNRDLFNILVVAFFLHFFFAWMIVYSPLYLSSLGWSKSDIGLVFTIALTAFVIFPFPAGWLADKYIGEKELLAGGFVLMAASTVFLPYLGTLAAPFWIWGIILFIGRAGASTVETMTEAYFFKKINASNASLVGYFRRTRPLAFAVAPFLASYSLETGLINLPGIFYVLGGLMLVALFFVARLNDTK